MVPQQDAIYLDLTLEEAENPTAELKQKVLDFFKKGTILWVVLRITNAEQRGLYVFVDGVYTDDNNWTFNFGAAHIISISTSVE